MRTRLRFGYGDADDESDQYIYIYSLTLTCVCPRMLFDAYYLIPLIVSGCGFTAVCITDCIKYSSNCALNKLNKKIQ